MAIDCGKEGNVQLSAKKMRGGDFLFHSLNFSLAMAYNQEKDCYYVPRAHQQNNAELTNCEIA